MIACALGFSLSINELRNMVANTVDRAWFLEWAKYARADRPR